MTSPIPAGALEQHIAVLGKTRSGKSSVMRSMVEGLLHRRLPVCIADPKGDWWGIKLAADGKGPGYPVVIFGGDHADVPINAHAGAHVAELFATGNRPCLIDLGGWRVGDRTRFWIDFASTVFRLTRGRRWLVVDEAHNFAPKGKIMDPSSGEALHWMNRLASEGLGKGLAMIFASQRPQKVHNDTLTSAETLIAMRVIHPSDRDAIAEWIKGCGDLKLGAKVLATLADLKRGEGWAWSPEIGFGPERVTFPMFRTYDSFRPQTASDAKNLKGWAEVDLEEVKAKLGAVVKEAEANDPKRLKARIAELERELKKAPAAAANPKEIEAVRSAAYADGCRDGHLEATAFFTEAVKSVVIKGNTLIAAGAELAAALKEVAPALAAPAPDVQPIRQPAPRTVASRAPAPRPQPVAPPRGNGAAEPLPKGERACLIAIAQHPDGVTREQLAVLTGYKRSSRDTYLQRLRERGHIDHSGGKIAATAAGIGALGSDYEPLPMGDELREHWLGRLPEGERRVLEAVVGHYPDAATKAEIDEATGYKRSSRDTYVQRLRARALVIVDRDGVRAADTLFG